MRSHHVYIFWRDTTPLYVGCTGNLARRMREHRMYSAFAKAATHISAIPFGTREEALAAETHYIGKLRPPNNVAGNPARRLLTDRLAGLEWDAEWFWEQPEYLQCLVNEMLGIHPEEVAARKRRALIELRWQRMSAA